MKELLIMAVLCFPDIIVNILGEIFKEFILTVIDVLVLCFFYYFGILSIVIGINFIKEKNFKKYYSCYSIINGLIVILTMFILKSKSNFSILMLLEKIIKQHGYYLPFMLLTQYIIVSIIFSISYLKERERVKKKILKEKEEKELEVKREKEKILNKIIEKNRKFSILFVYSEKDEFLRLKKVRLQEIAEKNMGMEFTEVNIDNKNDEEIKQNYLYSRYPFVAVLKEDEIIYKKEGMFKLIEIEKILKQYI